MTVKHTFTAGTTIVASQVNENFLTLPYAIQGGSTSVTGNQNVTFATSRFNVTPIVTATVVSAATTATSVTVTGVSATGMTLYVWTGATAATVARTVYWTALQMTSNNGVG